MNESIISLPLLFLPLIGDVAPHVQFDYHTRAHASAPSILVAPLSYVHHPLLSFPPVTRRSSLCVLFALS